MKKYLFGLIALTMVIAFSAFVTKYTAPKAAPFEESLYWYPVKTNGIEIDHTALINTSGTLTKTQMRTGNLVPCEEGSVSDCIRGFSELQNTDTDEQGADAVQKD